MLYHVHQTPLSCWVELKGCPSTKLYALLVALIDYCWPYRSSTVKYLTGYNKFKPCQQVLQILYLKASDKRNVELYLCSVGSTIQLGSYVLAVHKVCCSFTLELLSPSTFLTPSILQTLSILLTPSVLQTLLTLQTLSVLQTLLTLLIVSRSKTSKGSSTPQLSEPPVRFSSQEFVGEWSYMSLVLQARPNQPTPVWITFSITHEEGRVWWCSVGFCVHMDGGSHKENSH